MPRKLWWRFYLSNDRQLASMHCANSDRVWCRLFGKLCFPTEAGHDYIEVVARPI